jgi:hypothetical protein
MATDRYSGTSAPHQMPDHTQDSASSTGTPRKLLTFDPQVGSTSEARTIQWIAGLFLVAFALAAIGRHTGIETLQLVGSYGVVFIGVGAAPFQLCTGIDLYARLTGACLVGFSVLLGVGALMADLSGGWHPLPAAVAVGAVAVVLHVLGLARARTVPARRGALDDRFSSPPSANAMSRATKASLCLTVLGTLLWLGAAAVTRDPTPDSWGLIKAISPIWYLGLALVIVGFAVGRGRELSAGLATLSFGVATTLTPALVYGAPRSTTALKQMQVTQYVLTHHHIGVTNGIYQAYSAMFSGIAWFSTIAGLHGLIGRSSLFAVATYWPFLLVIMRVIELRLLTGRLLRTTPRRWAAVLLVLLVDSLGTDYFSPQSIGYVVAIGVVAMAVNGMTPRPLGGRWTALLLLLVGVTLAPTHELTPYLAGGALFILAVFGQAPLWAFVPITLPALAWVGVVHKVVGANFNFAQLFDLTNLQPPTTYATPGLERLPIVGYQSHTLLLALLLLVALGAIGFFTNIRSRAAWAYALCPIVGIGLILINPYGNEGIFRATVFAIPWMATLAVMTPRPRRRLRVLARPMVLTTGIAIVCGVLTITFVVAAYAMDATNVLPRSGVKVVDYLQRQPRDGAVVLTLGTDVTPVYSSVVGGTFNTLTWSQMLTTSDAMVTPNPTSFTLTQMTDLFGAEAVQDTGASHTSPLYVVWSRLSMYYAQEYGLASPTQMLAWLRLLRQSPNWQQVIADDGTYLFKLR